MPKFSEYICQQCGYKTASFLGKCPGCGEWNTFIETSSGFKQNKSKDFKDIITPQKLTEISFDDFKRISTGFSEFDRVLGLSSGEKELNAGIVPGSVTLISGEPGIGKSTLLLQAALNLASKNQSPVLYVSGEESGQQIKMRAERLSQKKEKINKDNLLILNENRVEAIIEQIKRTKPSVYIIDSIQTMLTEELSGVAGSVGQVRQSAAYLAELSKDLGIPVFLVGHVTKEGMIAGPKVLEHLVDTVLYLEGDTEHNFRILRSMKNRFGATSEVGIFEMREGGMQEVLNPSEAFLSQGKEAVAGSAIVATMEGTRPVMVEIQALTQPVPFGLPKRIGTGVDFGRLQLLTAVISKRLGLSLQSCDVYVNVVGGIKITEPATDLATSLAIVSSMKNKAIAKQTCVIGEVGLLGEVRQVNQLERRIKEAKKLGFKNFITPENCRTLIEALKKAF